MKIINIKFNVLLISTIIIQLKVLTNQYICLIKIILTFQEYKKEADVYLESRKPKTGSSTLLFIIVLFVIIFLQKSEWLK